MKRRWMMLVGILLCIVLVTALERMRQHKRDIERARDTIDELACMDLETGDQESAAFVKSVRDHRRQLRRLLDRGEVTPREIEDIYFQKFLSSGWKLEVETPAHHQSRMEQLEKKLASAEGP